MNTYDNPKVDALLEHTNGWSESDFRDLALAALDQSGMRDHMQNKVTAIIADDLDERAADDADQRHDDEINRRIDEARGK